MQADLTRLPWHILHVHAPLRKFLWDVRGGVGGSRQINLRYVPVLSLIHILPMDVRIHYCITNGGSAPNVVPDFAAVKYTFRALDINNMMDVERRLHKIAEGAAMMTETRVEIERLGGCYPVINNHVVADVVDECMRTIKMEEWSEENIEYARKLNETIPEEWAASVAFSNSAPDTQLHVGVMPIDADNDYGYSDIGDVSHIFPSCF